MTTMTTMTTGTTPGSLAVLMAWRRRRWFAAIAFAAATTIVVGVPTDLIDTPLFTRMVPAPWWTWPALVASSVLAGLLGATYVRDRQPEADATGSAEPAEAEAESRTPGRQGWVAGALTWFAVGCPVCNKLVLLALGTSGAMTWFEPAQPVLQLTALALLGWALRMRLRGEAACAWSPTRNNEESIDV